MVERVMEHVAGSAPGHEYTSSGGACVPVTRKRWPTRWRLRSFANRLAAGMPSAWRILPTLAITAVFVSARTVIVAIEAKLLSRARS